LDRLTRVQVIVIGVLVCLIVGAGMFFLLVRPKMQQYKEVSTKLEERKAVADQIDQARKDLEKARLENLQARLDYRRYEETKMPVISFNDRTAGMIALWRERAEVLGPLVEKWPRRFGVELRNDISIPAAPTNPNAMTADLLEIPLGQMTVTGSYRAILNHLKGWNKFNRLVRVDPPTLTGPSPTMTATYNLTVLIFPRGGLGPNVAIAGEAAAQPGAGGGPGMVPPAGGPVMPPAMPGGPGGIEGPPPPAGGGAAPMDAPPPAP
jgi:hypothetical protein